MLGRKRVLFILTGLLFMTQLLLSYPQSADASGMRLAGADRYRTAVAISQEGWKSSDYAILVRGDDFADALCAGPLASKYNAPILFTDKYGLNRYTLEELERLKADNVIIIGGKGVISGFIEDKLEDAGIDNIERIYGDDRYATSVEIAKRLGSREIAITNASQYTDALSISSIAAAKNFSILLTTSEELPDVVRDHIKNYRIQRTYLIGGTDVISKGIEKQVRAPMRLAGGNRYETNIKILEKFSSDLDFSKIYTASGEGADSYADSLAGVALAAKKASPIVLSGRNLPEVTKNFVEENATVATQVIALGGYEVIPDRVLDAFSQSVDSILKSVFNQKGTYGPTEGTTTISGNLVISAPGVTVQNTVIEGDLFLDNGIGSGSVELRNVTVKKRTTIRGGGDDSIIGVDFNSKEVVIDSPPPRNTALRLQGKSKIEEVIVESDAILDSTEVTGNGFHDVRILQGEEVTLKGKFPLISTKASGVKIKLQDGVLSTLNIQAQGEIFGNGTVATANISSNGVTITFSPAVTVVEKGLRAFVGGQTLTEGTTKYTPPPPPKAVPISDLSSTTGDSQATFSFGAPTGATSVILKQSVNGTSWTDASTGTLTASSTSAVAAGLINGQRYYFKLIVVGGSKAGESNVVQVTPIDPIDDLVSVPGDGLVILNFGAPIGAASVILKQSTDGGNTWTDSAPDSPLDSSSTTALLTGLTNGQEYKFKLIITGGARAGESNTVTTIPTAL